MTTKENINVPEAIAITSSCVVTDKPFAEGTPYFTAMKMIEDLGMLINPNKSPYSHYAIYECPACGKEFKTLVAYIQSGRGKSCGCIKNKRSFKHGLSQTRIYGVWEGMKARCYNKNTKRYNQYGGRGIIVCDEWKNDFITFLNWAGQSGYDDSLFLDRGNNDKNYSPDNCRWVTYYVNNQNTRSICANNTTGYRGVFFSHTGKKIKRWKARIGYNGKYYELGYFLTAELAAQAYNNFVIQHKTNHPLNKI